MGLFIVGVKKYDEVLIPPLSFVATANAVAHLGAIPHFVDIEKNTLSICPKKLKNYLNKIAEKRNTKVFNKKTKREISAIVPVHIFDNPANLIELKIVADEWGIPIVEDAAEALAVG